MDFDCTIVAERRAAGIVRNDESVKSGAGFWPW